MRLAAHPLGEYGFGGNRNRAETEGSGLVRRLLTTLAFVIAALPASGAAYIGKPTPISASVNLPDPKYSCGHLLAAASKRYHTNRFPKNSETIGKLYATAIRLESQSGHVDDFSHMDLQQLVAAYSDVMGCFVSHGVGVPSSSPSPHSFGKP